MVSACPICGSTHDSYNGVAMHMVKKQDGEHEKFETVDGALEHLSAEGLIGVGSGGEGVVVDTSEPPEPDPSVDDSENPLVGDVDPDDQPHRAAATDGGDCCGSPDLVDAAGERFRLESGDVLMCEMGDKFCSACGAIVEADGEVLR